MPSSSSRPTAALAAVSVPAEAEHHEKGKGKGKGKKGKGGKGGRGKGDNLPAGEIVPRVKTAQQEAKQVACLNYRGCFDLGC